MNLFQRIWLSLRLNHKDMDRQDIANTALLVHIEHSKPISVEDFALTMRAYGNLYSAFLKDSGIEEDADTAGLYVEKIEHNCIDIYLCELFQAGLLPFAENINTIFEFGKHLKSAVAFFTKGEGEEPKYTLSQLKDLKDLFGVTANDPAGSTTVSVIDKNNPSIVYKDCIFVNYYSDSNGAQNQIEKRIAKIKAVGPESEGIYKRVLMTIYQHRNDNKGKGNKAIIDAIIKKKPVNLLFDADELRDKILRSNENPTKKAYQVDVETQTANDKIVAYKVLALYEIIDIED